MVILLCFGIGIWCSSYVRRVLNYTRNDFEALGQSGLSSR